MYEIFVYGNGELMVDMLQFVVRIVGDGLFTTSLRLILLTSFALIVSTIMFKGDIMYLFRWLFWFMIIYQILFIPRVTVLVNDKSNPNLMMGNTVDNVPYVLAMGYTIITSIGNGFTELYEMNLAMPDDLLYSSHGMLFGNALISNVNSSRIQSPRVLKNLINYYRQCLITGVMLGGYSMDEISQETNLLKFISEKGSGILMYEYTDSNNNTNFYKCSESTGIKNDIEGETQSWISRNGRFLGNLFSNNSVSVDLQDLSIINDSYSYILGINKDASEIIKQNLMISALIDATENYAASTGSSATATNLAVIKDDLQRKMSASVSGKQANKVLPIMKAVAEIIIVGTFPFCFLLFILPNGWRKFLEYFGVIAYFQLWNPLFAILHRIMMGRAASRGADLLYAAKSGLSDIGISLSNYVGIQNLTDSIAVSAGEAAWSIPAFALAIYSGARFGMGFIQNMSSSAHQSAVQHSAEVSSGNISFGNANIDNSSYNNTHANKDLTDYVKSSGKRTVSDGTGFSRTIFTDGNSSVDTSSMQSHLLVDKNLVNSESMNISKELAETSAMREQVGKELSENQNYINSIENGIGKTHSIRVNDTNQLTDADREQIATLSRVGANASLGVNIPGFFSASGSAEIARDDQRIRELAKQGIISIEDNHGNDITENYRHSLSRQESLNNTISKLSSKENSLSNRQNYLNNLSIEERENLSNELVKYTANKYSPEEQQRILSDKDLTSKEFSKMISENNNYGIYNKINTNGYSVNTDILDKTEIGASYYNDNNVINGQFKNASEIINDNFINKRKEKIKNVDLNDSAEKGFKSARIPKKVRDKFSDDEWY